MASAIFTKVDLRTDPDRCMHAPYGAGTDLDSWTRRKSAGPERSASNPRRGINRAGSAMPEASLIRTIELRSPSVRHEAAAVLRALGVVGLASLLLVGRQWS